MERGVHAERQVRTLRSQQVRNDNTNRGKIRETIQEIWCNSVHVDGLNLSWHRGTDRLDRINNISFLDITRFKKL